MEIERKFTVKTLPQRLSDYPCKLLEQAYLNTEPVVRIRREDEQFYLTYKGKGMLAREEYNLPLDRDRQHETCRQTANQQAHDTGHTEHYAGKHRHHYSYGRREYHLQETVPDSV